MFETDTRPRELNPAESSSYDRGGNRGGYRSSGNYNSMHSRDGDGAGIDRSQESSTEYSPQRSEYGRDGRGDRTERSRNIKKQQVFKKRTCPFCLHDAAVIDYKDVDTLSKFLSDRGKILPSRVTSVCLKDQRDLSVAIKRARFLALLPYVND
jgi:small subunit ribosomal protein S18